MSDSEDEDIDPGRVNEARTKCKCYECHEVHQLDPSWTHDAECPSCNEDIFRFICEQCSFYDYNNEPSFPNQPCVECDRTQEKVQAEMEEETNCANNLHDEKERVSLGASFRAAKVKEPFPVYQNNIRLTYRAIYSKAPPNSPPISESDALRMREDDWEEVKPIIIAELGGERKAGSILNIQWCAHQMQVFERTWQSDNMAALERGTVEDWTGKPYMLALQSLRVRIRSLREVQIEEGIMPVAPAVKIDEEAWYKTQKYI